MKIVNRSEFLEMPAGTVFAKYAPCHFGDLLIKGDSMMGVRDFGYQRIVDSIDSRGSDEWVDLLFESQHAGKSLRMDFDCQGRDGLYDEAQLFAVWERSDVEALIVRLQEALGNS